MTKKSTMIKELPKVERPREKLLFIGPKGLTNSELLALILCTGTKEKNAVELSQEIIQMGDNGILDLKDVSLEELCQIKGIGVSKASKIVATIELARRIGETAFVKQGKVNSSKDIVTFFMEKLRYQMQEEFLIVLLNTKNEIIKYESISKGSLNASIVHPREVFNKAIRKSASAVILVHNHPSGHPNPSGEDKKVTERLVRAGEIVGITVLDHVIIGDKTYYSFKENALI